MLYLLDGALDPGDDGALINFLIVTESLLKEPLVADTNDRFSDSAAVEDHFDELRAWVRERAGSVRSQIFFNEPEPR